MLLWGQRAWFLVQLRAGAGVNSGSFRELMTAYTKNFFPDVPMMESLQELQQPLQVEGGEIKVKRGC